MDHNKLVERVNKLGVPLMTPEEKLDVNKTLAEVVKSHDVRLWEGFPVLVNSVFSKHQADLSKVMSALNRVRDQKAFLELAVLSKAVNEAYHMPMAELNKGLEGLRQTSAQLQDAFARVRNALAHKPVVTVANVQLSTERLKNTFESYLSVRNLEGQKQQAKVKELSLEYALSQTFSPKQKELFYKKLNNGKMTKTEREYYSRTVKRKVQALANDELHDMARKLMSP